MAAEALAANGQFDVLTATAIDLQRLLEGGELRSVDIVKKYFAQIDKHNRKGLGLHAIISVPPRELAIAKAQELDDERAKGKTRGPLHGIPVIVKDAIMTHPSLGMETTVGAYSLVGARPKENASVIDLLIEKGMIILGKANLTEFCGLKAKDMTPGWSAYGGQTLSAFRNPEAKDDQPDAGGSSAGSAVGVSAGFSPLALGTETSGSTVYPAGLAGLYAMKPTRDSVAMDGIFALSSAFDNIGLMAKSVADLALLLENCLTPAALEKLSTGGFTSVPIYHSWKDISIGFVDPKTWGPLPSFWSTPPVLTIYESAVTRMTSLGAHTVYSIDAPQPSTLYHNGESFIHVVAFQQFQHVLQGFLANLENTSMHTLADIIAYNDQHAATAMPPPHTDQSDLLAAIRNSTSPSESDAVLATIRRLAGPDGMAPIMVQHGVEIIAGPSHSHLVSFSAAMGWPIATVPLGVRENGEPFGLFLLAVGGSEDVLLRFMGAYEQEFGTAGGRVPRMLVEDSA